jgi:DNA polymerase
LQLIRDGDLESIKLLYANPMIVMRDALRSIVRAEKGKTLCVVDAAAIEAHVLGWVANCKLYQQAWAEKLDLYKQFAGVVFNCTIAEITPLQRFTGKQVVLSSGYQASDEKLVVTCKNQGLDITPELATTCVKSYRKTFWEIPKLWRDIQACCIHVVNSGGDSVVNEGMCPIRIRMNSGYLEIILPSGRSLWYPEARVQVQKRKHKGKIYEAEIVTFSEWFHRCWRRNSLYGGKTVENIVQGIARDLLAIVLVKSEEAGYNPVMHAHDEEVCEVMTSEAPKVLADMMKWFCEVPPWGKGLILGAEGFISDYYKKG